jgi:hypothetical protein
MTDLNRLPNTLIVNFYAKPMEHITKLTPIKEELKFLLKDNQNIEKKLKNITSLLLTKAEEYNTNLSDNTKILIKTEKSMLEKYILEASDQLKQHYLSLLEKITNSDLMEK